MTVKPHEKVVDDDQDTMLSKSKAPKRSTASRMRCSTKERLALPSARNSGNQHATRDPVVKHLLGDPSFKRKALEELESLKGKTKAEEFLIRTQARKEIAQTKEAEAEELLIRTQARKEAAQAKEAEVNYRYQLLLKRQELISKGVPTEQVDAILPLPDFEQSSNYRHPNRQSVKIDCKVKNHSLTLKKVC